MDAFLIVCAAVVVFDAVARRRKLASLAGLRASDDPVAADHLFLVADGVHLSDSVRRAASAHARTHGLSLVELVPARQPTAAWLWLTWVLDPPRWRQSPFATGFTGGHAILVTADLLARARVGAGTVPPVELAQRALRLRRFAGRTADVVVAPDLSARERGPHADRAVMRTLAGGVVFREVDAVVLATPLVLAAALIGACIAAPVAGLVLLATWHVAAAVCVSGQRFEAPDATRFAAGRILFESLHAIELLRQRVDADSETPHARAVYERMLECASDRFFGPRVLTCPMCERRGTLKPLFTTLDDYQHKPGKFTLERCDGCGHVLQNPPLTEEGLAFYYRDFYDGLGEELTERVFASYGPVYEARATMVKRHARPDTWLDVGCGHGHFCYVGGDELPDTEFHGLDMSESVEEAARRGWIARSHRGRFPQLADRLGEYDVVSMHHYLEHVPDPGKEIEAAGRVVKRGGHLLIEVPDPESRWAKLLGRWWVLWLQPQHLHFVTVAGMDRLLRNNGFRPIEWHHGEAHMPIDLSWMVVLLLQRLGPRTDQPWQPPSTRWERIRRRVVWTVGLPLLLLAGLLDRLLAPLAERGRFANLYRVLAVKEA